MQVLFILILILAILLVIFTLQNSMELSINIFFWEIPNAPLVLVLIACILLGYILALFYLYPKIWRLKKEVSQIQKHNKGNEKINETDITYEEEDIRADNDDPEGIEMEEIDDNSFFKD